MLKLLNGIVELINNLKECSYCKNIGEYEYDVYRPFHNESDEILLCERCNDYAHETFTMCEGCYRYVYNNNGLRKNIRYDDNDESFYCVKCLQDEWFIKGMKNFQDADFFSYKDLSEHGFVKWHSFFCRTDFSYRNVERIFNELKDKGNRVIVNIDSSGMGLEHYISLYIKPKAIKMFINFWKTLSNFIEIINAHSKDAFLGTIVV